MPTIATASPIGHAYGPADKIEKDGKTYAKVRFWTKDKIRGQEEPEFTSWSALVAGPPAEWLIRDCRKGSLVTVSGTIRLAKWTNKDGKETHTLEFTRVTEARVLDAREEQPAETNKDEPAPRRHVPRPSVDDDSGPPF